MFHPISLNVLRQSLSFANLPRWIKLISLGTELRAPGCIIASYQAVFDLREMSDAMRRYESVVGHYGTSWQELFLSAFSVDVNLVDSVADWNAGKLYITFTTRLGKAPDNG